MNTAHSQVLSRISKIVLAGIGVAFAWLVLTMVFGLSSSDARADDAGLLDGLGSTVTDTASGAADVASDTAATVTETVATVIPAVVSTPPVQPAAPVVQTVTTVVAPVVNPVVTHVSDVSGDGVATPIIDGVNDTVGAVPIVGEASAALGLDDALAAVGASVDTVLAGTTAAAGDAVTGVLDPITGLAPGTAPVQDVATGILTPGIAQANTDASPQPLEALARAASLTVATTWAAVTNPASATESSASGAFGFGVFTLLRSALQAESALSGPAGAGLGAWALIALGPVVAYRAWMRRSGPENDVAPPAPAFSTDVSPD